MVICCIGLIQGNHRCGTVRELHPLPAILLLSTSIVTKTALYVWCDFYLLALELFNTGLVTILKSGKPGDKALCSAIQAQHL
jgi:hypothetical protein